MKTFSKAWIKSKLPKKQRKYRINAPSDVRRKMISSHLGEELSKKYGKRAFPLKVGDKVKIMRGEFKNVIGKVEEISVRRLKVFIAGAERSKGEGMAPVKYSIDPSNVKIIELDLGDKKRKAALERKAEDKK